MEDRLSDLSRFDGASVSVEELRRDREGVTIAYLEESYADTDADLRTVAEIINRACRSKAEVERLLSRHRLYGYMDFETDTIGLEKMVLIFENDTLKAVAEYR